MTTGDRATLVLFGRKRRGEHPRHVGPRAPRGDRHRARHPVRRATVPRVEAGRASCRCRPAAAREAILISDFQKSGWTGAEDIRFGENMTLTPVSVAEGESTNISIPSVTFGRAEFSGQERITVNAGVS